MVKTMEDLIEERKKKIIEMFNLKKNWFWFVFAIIAYFGYWIRTRNLAHLIDNTTGKYIPLALDPYAFLRYAKHILETGNLMVVDYMRYYPWGYSNMVEFKLLSYAIVYLYKFLHFFNSSMTLEKAHVLYPPIAFVIGLMFFFLLIKKLFDYRVALLSSLLLSIIPMYLYRTMAGFSDKEAFAMIFFFAILYFFVVGWKSTNWKKIFCFGAISGILTGLMVLIWGGVYFLVVTIALFTFISLFFVRFRTYHFLAYANWLILFSLFLMIFRNVSLIGLVGGLYNGFAFLTLLSGFVYYLLFKRNIFGLKNKIKNKIPMGVSSIIVSSIIGLLFFIIYDFSFIVSNLKELFITFTSPFGQSRWALTVAEAHQPYFLEWINQMSWKYVLGFLSGSIFLFYDMGKRFFNKSNRIIFTGLYSLMLICFVFNRYSQSSIFNGESTISRILYFGSILVFVSYFAYYYFSTFKKNKKLFNRKKNINESYLIIIVWFFVMIMGARSASRLLFVLAPITTILFSFLIFRLYDLSLKKKDVYKIGTWVLLFLLLINPFSISSFAYGLFDSGVVNDFYSKSIGQARGTGPSYNVQWQNAGQWVRGNTDEDAVFSHWWDYGYWVQTGFERATVTDGGNAKGSLNHMIGRHLLTGQNEIEALEFLKAHNVTHSLMISDEIGKYPAFSSIGADENWDRYSWINVFTRDDTQMQETRDGIVYAYTGGTPLDWDFEYKGKIYPKGSSGVVAILLPSLKNEEEQTLNFGQPQAILTYNGQQDVVPLECVFINGQEMEYPEKGLKGCFVMVPKINGNQVDNLGNGFYISEKVRNTLFYKMYLTSQEMEYFDLVYNDEENMPLSVYNGRVIGPMKIWEVSYPDDLEVPEIYYRDELPNPGVDNVEGRY